MQQRRPCGTPPWTDHAHSRYTVQRSEEPRAVKKPTPPAGERYACCAAGDHAPGGGDAPAESVCTIVQLPQRVMLLLPALSLASLHAAHGRRGRSPAGPASPQADRRHGGGGDHGATGSRLAPWSTPARAIRAKLANNRIGIDQAHVTQDLPQVIEVPPGDDHDGHAGGPRRTSACRTLGSSTRPVLDASRPLALDLLSPATIAWATFFLNRY